MKNLFFPIALIFCLLAACETSVTKTVEEAPKPAFDEALETEAILKVIQNETDCFFKGDYECWASNWSHADYAMQAWNHEDGTYGAAIGWDSINAQGKGWIEKYYKNGEVVIHPVVKKEKPLVKFFNETTAYLLWKQYNADEKNEHYKISQESRIMEKEGDAWKIVNVSAFWDAKTKIPVDSLKLDN